jgi:hypothetical protein
MEGVTRVRRGHEPALLSAAGAEMLVVGDRGAGGLGPPGLGPVGQAMIYHAPCAVTVTHTLGPSNEEPRRDGRAEEERRRVGVTPFERLRLIRDFNERIVVRPDKLEID